MIAHCLVREQPWYRRDAFVEGLKAAGHSVLLQAPGRISKDTLLVIWNRYSGNHDLALRVEAGGGTVIVAENGYLGTGGTSPKFDVHPKGPKPGDYYALSIGFHNDHSRVRVGEYARFARLAVDLKPMRDEGDCLLVCPNRSFGIAGRIMPTDWAEHTAAALKKKNPGIEVRIRKHPGNNEPQRPLIEDLARAKAVYVWSSSCGVHALAEGIPLRCDAPYWIMKNFDVVGREAAFERMAWAQWTMEEISRGDAFRHLLLATG